jgi:hypothetical protein
MLKKLKKIWKSGSDEEGDKVKEDPMGPKRRVPALLL